MNRLFIGLLTAIIVLLPCREISAKQKKEVKEVPDREVWCDVMYRMAAPVLSNMSRGELQKNMQVELSPTWDGRDKRVTYMECFGRLMAGLAPWLSLPDDDTTEGRQRKQLREWALQSYAQAVDPASPVTCFGVKRVSHWWSRLCGREFPSRIRCPLDTVGQLDQAALYHRVYPTSPGRSSLYELVIVFFNRGMLS